MAAWVVEGAGLQGHAWTTGGAFTAAQRHEGHLRLRWYVLVLARAVVDVLVLEQYRDFFRDFHGDTLHASPAGVRSQDSGA
jgi:hypothetical protein